MNTRIIISIFILTGLITSCSAPKLTVTKEYPRIENIDEIYLVDINNPELKNAEEIGFIEIGDLDFSYQKHGLQDCSYSEVIKLAKINASKIGGNIICITKHTPPSTMGSMCHRINAKIFRSSQPEKFKIKDSCENIVPNKVILKIYRPRNGANALVNYNLKLNDSILCKVTNGFAQIITLDDDVSGELKANIGLLKHKENVEFKMGQIYYIQCGTEDYGYNARPVFGIIEDKNKAKLEFEVWNQ